MVLARFLYHTRITFIGESGLDTYNKCYMFFSHLLEGKDGSELEFFSPCKSSYLPLNNNGGFEAYLIRDVAFANTSRNKGIIVARYGAYINAAETYYNMDAFIIAAMVYEIKGKEIVFGESKFIGTTVNNIFYNELGYPPSDFTNSLTTNSLIRLSDDKAFLFWKVEDFSPSASTVKKYGKILSISSDNEILIGDEYLIDEAPLIPNDYRVPPQPQQAEERNYWNAWSYLGGKGLFNNLTVLDEETAIFVFQRQFYDYPIGSIQGYPQITSTGIYAKLINISGNSISTSTLTEVYKEEFSGYTYNTDNIVWFGQVFKLSNTKIAICRHSLNAIEGNNNLYEMKRNFTMLTVSSSISVSSESIVSSYYIPVNHQSYLVEFLYQLKDLKGTTEYLFQVINGCHQISGCSDSPDNYTALTRVSLIKITGDTFTEIDWIDTPFNYLYNRRTASEKNFFFSSPTSLLGINLEAPLTDETDPFSFLITINNDEKLEVSEVVPIKNIGLLNPENLLGRNYEVFVKL